MGVEHDWMFNRLFSHDEVNQIVDKAIKNEPPIGFRIKEVINQIQEKLNPNKNKYTSHD